MPRDAVSRTANVERTGRHKWAAESENVMALHAEKLRWKIKLTDNKLCCSHDTSKYLIFEYFYVEYFEIKISLMLNAIDEQDGQLFALIII